MRSSTFRLRLASLLAAFGLAASLRAEPSLLNASYDVSREFYKEFNPAFAAHWKAQTGTGLTLNQSHGGSSKQVRSVIDGLEADVVTMNNPLDIEALAKAQLIPADWAKRLPHDSSPYSSTILFLVRKGNPKAIKDWSDLVRPGVAVILPNPKTAGNGRYSYLAAWGYAQRAPGGDAAKAQEFVRRLFANVPVLDAGGRGATTTFAQRGLGDVLLTFENEIALIQKEFGADAFEPVVPTTSILAVNPVVWVDPIVKRRGTEALAKAYLEFLYSDAGQELAVKQHFRPSSPAVLARHAAEFPALPLFTVEEVFGTWAQAQATHFADGALFDQIFAQR